MERFRTRAAILIAIVMLSLFAPVLEGAQVELGDDRFESLKAYSAALERLESHFAEISGSCWHVVHSDVGSERERTVLVQRGFARSRVGARLVSIFNPNGSEHTTVDSFPKADITAAAAQTNQVPYRETARSYNGKYGLKLKRLAKDKPYQVDYFGTNIALVKREIDRVLARVCDCSTSVGGIRVLYLISLPGFRLEQVWTENAPTGERTRRFVFSLRPNPGSHSDSTTDRRKRPTLRSGWIRVLPSQQMAVREFALLTHAGQGPAVLETGVIEYRYQPDGFPVPATVRTRLISCNASDFSTASDGGTKGTVLNNETFEITQWHVGGLDGEQFRSGFFGVPEIPLQEGSNLQSRLLAGVLGLALVMLVASIGLRRLASVISPRN